MDLEQYRIEVRRNMRASTKAELAMFALGLVGELQEAIDACGEPNQDEELGDFLWYVVAFDECLSDLLGATQPYVHAYSTNEYPDLLGTLLGARKCVAGLAELTKKFWGHNRDIPLYEFRDLLWRAYAPLRCLREEQGSSVLQQNVNKLRARYPQGAALALGELET